MKKILAVLLALLLLAGCINPKDNMLDGDGMVDNNPVSDNNPGGNDTGKEDPDKGDDKGNEDPDGGNETGYGDPDYGDDMDWAANSLNSIRQVILDSGAMYGIASLGFCDGPIGDGIIDIIEGTAYQEDLPFILQIPFERYVGADGPMYYVIVPEYDVTLRIINDDEIIVYEAKDGEPIIVNMPVHTDSCIIAERDGIRSEYHPGFYENNILDISENEPIYDFTIYDVD